jgi:uncharacterized protein YecE (DUF72 family)
MIWVGTSGFQYPEWKGSFYPRDLSAAKMLPYYAERFTTTEVNYSFYRIPSLKTLTNWDAATPPEFRFSFKAPKEITHIRRLRDCNQVLERFHTAIESLKGKLGVVLFQLPPFFKKDLPLLQDFLGALPAGIKSTFEFRHQSWFDDESFGALKAAGAALCIAESEKLATPVVFTAGHAYLRLRREDYSKKDIARWAAVIAQQRKQREDIHVYFKHEEAGVGPKFARQLVDELS